MNTNNINNSSVNNDDEFGIASDYHNHQQQQENHNNIDEGLHHHDENNNNPSHTTTSSNRRTHYCGLRPRNFARLIVFIYFFFLPPLAYATYLFFGNTVADFAAPKDTIVSNSIAIAEKFLPDQVFKDPAFILVSTKDGIPVIPFENSSASSSSSSSATSPFTSLQNLDVCLLFDFIQKIGSTKFNSSDPATGGYIACDGFCKYLEYPHIASEFFSKDRKLTLIMINMEKTSAKKSSWPLFESEINHFLASNSTAANLKIEITSQGQILDETESAVLGDLVVIDGIAVPIAFITLALCLRSFRMLLVAASQIGVTIPYMFGIMYGVSTRIGVSSFAPECSSACIMALSIDYSLFIGSRFNERVKLAILDGLDISDEYTQLSIVLETTKLVAHNIVVSGLSVGIALGGLVVVPLDLIATIGISFFVGTLVAVVVAMTLQPAILMAGFDFFARDPGFVLLFQRFPLLEKCFGDDMSVSNTGDESLPAGILLELQTQIANDGNNNNNNNCDDKNSRELQEIATATPAVGNNNNNNNNEASLLHHQQQHQEEETVPLVSPREIEDNPNKNNNNNNNNSSNDCDGGDHSLSGGEQPQNSPKTATLTATAVSVTENNNNNNNDTDSLLSHGLISPTSAPINAAHQDTKNSNGANNNNINNNITNIRPRFFSPSGNNSTNDNASFASSPASYELNLSPSEARRHQIARRAQYNSTWFKIGSFAVRNSCFVVLVLVVLLIPFIVAASFLDVSFDLFSQVPRGSDKVRILDEALRDIGTGSLSAPFFVSIDTGKVNGLGYPQQDINFTLPFSNINQFFPNAGSYPGSNNGNNNNNSSNSTHQIHGFNETVFQVIQQFVVYISGRTGIGLNRISSYVAFPGAGLGFLSFEADALISCSRVDLSAYSFSPSSSSSSSSSIDQTRTIVQGCKEYNKLVNRTVDPTFQVALIIVAPPFDSFGPRATKFLNDLKHAIDEFDAQGMFAAGFFGASASNWQILQSMLSVMPTQIGITFGVIFVIVAVVFRSAVIPFRMLFTMAYTLVVSFGAATFLIQMPVVRNMWGATSPDAFVWLIPLFAFSLLCALALDYDVFILSRIVEYKKLGFSNDAACCKAVWKSGRVVTFACIIMFVSFTSLMFSRTMMLQQFGLVSGIAVLIDGFVIRPFLVPALMNFQIPPNFCWYPLRFDDETRTTEDMTESQNE